MRRRLFEIAVSLALIYFALFIFYPFLPRSIAGPIQAIIPQAVPPGFFVGGQAKFGTTDSSGNYSTSGSYTSGAGSSTTGALDLIGKTSSNTVTLTVADNTGAGTLTFPGITATLPGISGSPTTNNCVNWASANTLGDAGAACGSGSGGAGATLFSSTSTATVTAASDTTLIGTVTGSTTIPANTWTAGSVTHLFAQGYYSTPAAARTLNIKLNIGGSTRVTTGAVTVIPSVTNGTWQMNCIVTTRTTGAGGAQIANCQFTMSGATLTSPQIEPLQTASTWTMNTTTTEAVDLTAAWDSTTGSPTISCSNIAAWIPGSPVTSVNGQTGAIQARSGNPYIDLQSNLGNVSGNATVFSTTIPAGTMNSKGCITFSVNAFVVAKGTGAPVWGVNWGGSSAAWVSEPNAGASGVGNFSICNQGATNSQQSFANTGFVWSDNSAHGFATTLGTFAIDTTVNQTLTWQITGVTGGTNTVTPIWWKVY